MRACYLYMLSICNGLMVMLLVLDSHAKLLARREGV